MSAQPPSSASLSTVAAAQPAAAAASAPEAAGFKRRANNDDVASSASSTDHVVPEAMSAADASSIHTELSGLRSELVGLGDRPVLAALARERIAALEAALDRDADDSKMGDVGAASSPLVSAVASKKQKHAHELAAPCAASSDIAAAPKAPFARWSTLYSDALHSIFKFATLVDLARLMCVSQRWGEAVLTAPSIAVPIAVPSDAHLSRMLGSRILRHVSTLRYVGSSDPYPVRSVAQLQSLADRSPSLTELCVLSYLDGVRQVCAALSRFNHLRSLRLDCLGGASVSHPSFSEACSSLMETIGGLNSATMRLLSLVLPMHSDLISFAPLANLTQLQVFRFWLGANSPEVMNLTNTQMSELGALSTSVAQLNAPFSLEGETAFLTRMLQPGHSLRWTKIRDFYRGVMVDAPLAAVLGSLHTLTSLPAWLRCADVAFFAQLTQLTDLDLSGYNIQGGRVDSDALVESLRHCTQISTLELSNFELSGRHLRRLFPALHRLSVVELSHLSLRSLGCFATPQLAATLTSLRLRWMHGCPSSELSHLLGLRSLEWLGIGRLAGFLSDEDKAAFVVPSMQLPALKHSAFAIDNM